jgi:hypothetical protein
MDVHFEEERKFMAATSIAVSTMKAAQIAAYTRMLSGDAQFRVVLTM